MGAWLFVRRKSIWGIVGCVAVLIAVHSAWLPGVAHASEYVLERRLALGGSSNRFVVTDAGSIMIADTLAGTNSYGVNYIQYRIRTFDTLGNEIGSVLLPTEFYGGSDWTANKQGGIYVRYQGYYYTYSSSGVLLDTKDAYSTGQRSYHAFKAAPWDAILATYYVYRGPSMGGSAFIVTPAGGSTMDYPQGAIPDDIAASPEKRVYLAHGAAGALSVWEPAGSEYLYGGGITLPSGAAPVGIIYDPTTKRVLVSDYAQHVVRVYSENLAPDSVFGGYGTQAGFLEQPTCIDIGPDGCVYVRDQNGISIFRLRGRELRYESGAGGSLDGLVAQTVGYGQDGAPVLAIPSNGYRFVKWSDGSIANPRSDANVQSDISVKATFEHIVRPVTRAYGSDRYGTAAALARKGWDPTGKLAWSAVKHIIIANGEPGKESDPLSAAGLAGAYDAPVLVVQLAKVPSATKTVITEIAKKNPGVKIHLVGGTSVVPDARWNEIKKIPGVSQTKDRFAGRDRYETSALMATRIVDVKGAAAVTGVILIAGDNPAAFYDALAASPIAYAQTMPMLSVKKGSIPTSVNTVLSSASLEDKPRYVASSVTYVGSTPAKGATRLTTSSNRYTAATQIATFASINRRWTSRADTAIASKLPDALTGGALLGKKGGMMLFTDSGSAIQTTSKAFITGNSEVIMNGWVIGGTSVVPTTQETSFRNLLK